jgi:sugar transferase (PEP-CTERM/EpsH1 system associated)
MAEVLFLAHRIPFPADRGDKIRSHHVLRAIARLAPVHVACFADDDHDLAEEFELADIAASHCLVERTKPVVQAGLEALARGLPVSLAAFRHPLIAAYVAEVLATRPISTIYVFSGQMGQYVPADFAGRVVMDFVDVDSAKFDAYARTGALPMRWINAREARLLRDEEARLAMRADASLLITAEEAALFTSRLNATERAFAEVQVLGNGMDSAAYDPVIVAPELCLLECSGPRLIFTGQMDYAPNAAACLRAIDRIMPLVRAGLPGATFHVVGRNPGAELLARDGIDGVHVWGRVNDIRTWLKAADMALVPLEIARGVQNKVLEAMAMALPVVLSPGAATGIPATDGEQFRIAATDADLAAAVIALWQDQWQAREMGAAARRFITEKVSWNAALAGLPALLGLSTGRVRHAA